MQDRYKFRAWNKKTKTIHNVTEIGFKDYDNFMIGHICMALGDSDWVALENISNVKLMQCTGLKDKTGKLIYEGDICFKKGNKYCGKKEYSKVIFSESYAQFCLSDRNGIHQIPINSLNIEVVGNIYEPPEEVTTGIEIVKHSACGKSECAIPYREVCLNKNDNNNT